MLITEQVGELNIKTSPPPEQPLLISSGSSSDADIQIKNEYGRTTIYINGVPFNGTEGGYQRESMPLELELTREQLLTFVNPAWLDEDFDGDVPNYIKIADVPKGMRPQDVRGSVLIDINGTYVDTDTGEVITFDEQLETFTAGKGYFQLLRTEEDILAMFIVYDNVPLEYSDTYRPGIYMPIDVLLSFMVFSPSLTIKVHQTSQSRNVIIPIPSDFLHGSAITPNFGGTIYINMDGDDDPGNSSPHLELGSRFGDYDKFGIHLSSPDESIIEKESIMLPGEISVRTNDAKITLNSSDKCIIFPSATEGSTKKFALSITDDGTLSIQEYKGE